MQIKEDTILSALAHAYAETLEHRYVTSALDRVIELDYDLWSRITDKSNFYMENVGHILRDRLFGTVHFKDRPFHFYKPLQITHPGFLYNLVSTAQDTVDMFECSIETGIMTCIAGDAPHIKPPDDLTVKALNHLLTRFQITCNVRDIKETFPELPWPVIREEVWEIITQDVSKERRTLAGQRPFNTEYPKFCQSEKRVQGPAYKSCALGRPWIRRHQTGTTRYRRPCRLGIPVAVT